MEVTVYRDIIGTGNHLRRYDLDVEIVRREGPMTRATTNAIKNKLLYSVNLIWSHTSLKECKITKLSCDQESELENHVHDSKNLTDEKIAAGSWFAIGATVKRTVYLIMRESGLDLTTFLVDGGVDRIMQTLRVRRYLERRSFIMWLWPSSQHEIESELFRLCLCFSHKLKTAVTVESPVTSIEYESSLKQLESDDSFTSVVVDAEILFERTIEALGREIMTHRRGTINQLRELLTTSGDTFNLPFDQWGGEEAFVRGVWNLHLS